MTEALFSCASLAAVAAWCLLAWGALLPQGRLRALLLSLAGRAAPLALCALYASLLALRDAPPPGAGFGSLAAVMRHNAAPAQMLTGWVHLLALDLLIGRWIVDEALNTRYPRAAALLVLSLTFLYAPLGLLAWLALSRVCGGIMAGRTS